jgi:hypothetical protein
MISFRKAYDRFETVNSELAAFEGGFNGIPGQDPFFHGDGCGLLAEVHVYFLNTVDFGESRTDASGAAPSCHVIDTDHVLLHFGTECRGRKQQGRERHAQIQVLHDWISSNSQKS